MQTIAEIESITNDYGVALQIYKTIAKHVGNESGDYTITDIECIGSREKDVELICGRCGYTIHSILRTGRNKWSELPKICPQCTKAKKEGEKQRVRAEAESVLSKEIGERYGDYVIDRIKMPGKKLIAKCATCGAEKEWAYEKIMVGANINTRCAKHHKKPVKFDETYIGKKNGKLIVLAIARGDDGKKKFLCLCDCGNIAVVKPTWWENGTVKSCGCLASGRVLEHSETLDRLRRIHSGMLQRCFNQNSPAYKYYGARGIKVCDEWLNDRESFISWALSNGYSNDLTIDRINVDGDYEPANCRWATYKEQAQNKRPNPKKPERKPTFEFHGEKRFIGDIYAEYNTSSATVRYRMEHFGLSFEDALTMKKKTKGRPRNAERQTV